MNKKVFFSTALLCFSSASFACDVPSDEKLVCEVVLCNPIGLVISESRSKCMKVNRRFAIYLATLGFWDKPPKCKLRNAQCQKTGNAGSDATLAPSFCEELPDRESQLACLVNSGNGHLIPPDRPLPPEICDGRFPRSGGAEIQRRIDLCHDER